MKDYIIINATPRANWLWDVHIADPEETADQLVVGLTLPRGERDLGVMFKVTGQLKQGALLTLTDLKQAVVSPTVFDVVGTPTVPEKPYLVRTPDPEPPAGDPPCDVA